MENTNTTMVPDNGSILRSGLNFKKATLEASHDMILCGHFEGNIISSAKVTLESTANFKGTLKCKDFECNGHFDGNLDVDNFALFHSTSIVNGKINVGHFSAEDGATFTSEIKVSRKAAAPAPAKK